MVVTSIGRLLLGVLLLAGLFLLETAIAAGSDPVRRPRHYHRRGLLGPEAADIDVKVHASQSGALRQLFEPLNIASLQRLNWDFLNGPAEYCYFVGLECDTEGYITGIDLTNQGLIGRLPDRFVDLTRLRRLAMYGNRLSGPLPQSLLSLTSLNKLNLGQNTFSGPFPVLPPSLTRVILDRNSFSGTIPSSMCELQDLESLDLATITGLSGTLPACLGSLTALTRLRVTDAGFDGPVPPLLCTEREMNGLAPNTFGCDAIACEPGSYQRPAGRQVDSNSPCLKCDVPSNTIGSSSCQSDLTLSNKPSTMSNAVRSTPPTTQPSSESTMASTQRPTTMPSTQNSDRPTILQLRQSFFPSSSLPSIQASTTTAPTVNPSPPAVAMKRPKDAWRSKLYIAAGILIPASLCMMIPFLFSMRCSNHPKVEITDSTELLEPDMTRSSDTLDESLVRIINNNHETRRVPDDAAGSTGSEETDTGATTRPAETKKYLSPSSCRIARRVAFPFPETIEEDPSGERLAAMSASSAEEEEQVAGPTSSLVSEPPQPTRLPNDEAPQENSTKSSSHLDRWLVNNPMFYPLRSCHAPCSTSIGGVPEESTSTVSPCVVDDDQPPIYHHSHHYHNHDEPEEDGPASGRISPSTITMDNMEMSHSGDELEAVLGIRHPRRGGGEVTVVNHAHQTTPTQQKQTAGYQLALALLRSADRQGNGPADDDHDKMGPTGAARPLFPLDDNYHDVVEMAEEGEEEDDEKRREVAKSSAAADTENNDHTNHAHPDHHHHQQQHHHSQLQVATFCFRSRFDQKPK